MSTSTPSLLLDDSFFVDVLNGIITATIRIGDRPVAPGRLMLMATNGGYLPLLVYVDSVVKTSLVGINELDARRAGYFNSEDAIADMYRRYPEAKPNTPFTVIRFERVL